MTGHYLAEFSVSYKPVKHGRPGVRMISAPLFPEYTDVFPLDRRHAL